MRANWKALVFLLIISLVLILGGKYLGGRQGLMLGFLLALSINALLYFSSDAILLSLIPHRRLLGQDPWGLRELVKELSQQARIPVPEIYLVSFQGPGALALGRSTRKGKILLSEGILQTFNREELRAIVAFQIEAIRRESTQISTFVTALFGGLLMVGVAERLDRALAATPFFAAHNTRFFARLAAPFVFFAYRLSLSRQSFYLLDQYTAELIGNPSILAQVLWKMEALNQSHGLPVPSAMAPLFMVNPIALTKNPTIFKLQPTTMSRIRKLVGFYPI